MKREDWVRLGMHLPWGILGALLQAWRADYGLMAISLMLGYEAFNDWRKKDRSYKDVLGIVWGYLLGAILIWGFTGC